MFSVCNSCRYFWADCVSIAKRISLLDSGILVIALMDQYDCCQPFDVSVICDFRKNLCVELRFSQKIVEAVAIFATEVCGAGLNLVA